MKAFTVLFLASTILFISIIALTALAYDEHPVGVKTGDWIEYTVRITGQTPTSKNITWFKTEILEVEGAAFQAKMTVRYVNGTLRSTIWKFNFTEGNVGGWVIIPPNLNPGNTFFDAAKPANITIEGEEQKIVAGATRTITHACDSTRIIKEWMFI